MASMRPIFIAGPVSWNTLVMLDHLPEPVPHMQFATRDWQTLGGTSAGKALSLAGLGRPVYLRTLLGDDAPGRRIREALSTTTIELDVVPALETERHLNLMTPAGERVSLYLATPDSSGDAPDDDMLTAMSRAAAIVLDLSAEGRRLIAAAQRQRETTLWVDLHDYDGRDDFHRPFLEAADVVLCSEDRLPRPTEFLRSCVENGASLAVCTRGADGAVAVDDSGRVYNVPAPSATVIDTNGAGDAFFAGLLNARLDGRGVIESLEAASAATVPVLASRHLHPLLESVLPASGVL
ncbi:carbohydrate kinase family protein [Microbacterium sorbitolivorans]|uniref:Carbohydrate kinase family protein n=2 Tax=Microbacterium sorbitolivorans TaxID=1867410 RepID=A0A367XXQ5_9MICO|nr:carbohydrate kinase family protein [Microbacterium sorbitolivorans]